MSHGIFAGLCTLDVIQSVTRVPGANEKVTALRQTVAAGGPATNAAVTFAHLGGAATLITAVGRHPLTAGIRADLAGCGVALRDLAPGHDGPPPVSTVLVTAGSGDRAVASTNAAGLRLVPPADLDFDLDGATALQVDGHHPALAEAALRAARASGVPTILDAGSWKEGTERLLPLADVVAASADFRLPGGAPLATVPAPWLAVTDGAGPIRWRDPDGRSGEVEVPAVSVVDTLGAGDVFHGALTHAIAGTPDAFADFPALLARAARVASRACTEFGTRTWMHHTGG